MNPDETPCRVRGLDPSGQPTHPARAVMFDLDGTLLDSLADLAAATNAALSEQGCPTHPESAYRYFVGDGVRALVSRAMPPERREDGALFDRLLAGQRAHYGNGWNRQTRPYDGIPALLAALAGRGVPTAVFSNKPDDFTRAMVAHYFPDHVFADVRGARPGTPLKPNPAGAVAIAEALAIPPPDWLYLGDTGIDMQTARSAGMIAAGVLWGFRPVDELRDAGAGILLRRPEDALAYVRF